MKPAFFFSTPLLAVTLMAHAAVADPVTDLQCLEAEWSESAAKLQENRATVWQWLHDILNRPDQVACGDEDFVNANTDWQKKPEFSWTCLNGYSNLTITLSFQLPDKEKRDAARSGLMVLGAIHSISNPELINALQTAIEDTAQNIEEELEAAGIDITFHPEPESSASTKTNSEETISLNDLLANALPLQNKWGLTADLVWTPASFDLPDDANDQIRARYLGEMRGRIENVQHIDYILRSQEKAQVQPGIAMQNAAAAHANVVATTEEKANIWAAENLDIAARNFRLFGEEVEILQRDADSISVVDTRSWSQSPGADWQNTSDAQIAEGVNELVFYFEPQPDFERQNPANSDCRITKTFPCPPFKGLNSAKNDLSGVWTEACETAKGCDVTTLRWINDHVVVRTHLRAKNADAAYLSRFTGKMLTLRTKSMLAAFEPDPEFDPGQSCQ
ncbi:hypothetical protein [Ruegeria arenilitoris]|uniref:hypothetical protein n=1 Tax=Ruegeria arenilitoris TaxID=1173585 RepID=UPI00147FEFB7|nr:hypothetical protein [Ruegeria arenilitoris]